MEVGPNGATGPHHVISTVRKQEQGAVMTRHQTTAARSVRGTAWTKMNAVTAPVAQVRK